MASDGTLYLSYGTSPGPSRMTAGGVWKCDTNSGAWTEITPVKPDASRNESFGWAAVSVDAHNPKVAIASTFGRMNGAGGEDDMFRTIDGGKTWKAVFGGGGGGTYDFSLAPYTATTPIHWMFDIEIEPADSKHAMFTTGYGGWETFNLTDLDAGKPTRWSIMASGIEQTAELEMASPTKGAHLLSAIGDYGGFVHWDLDKPSPEGASSPPVFNNTSGIVYAENKPEAIVRVGVCSHHPLPASTSVTRSTAARPGSRRPPSRRPCLRRPDRSPAEGGRVGRVGETSRFLPMAHVGLDYAGRRAVLNHGQRRHVDAVKGLPANVRIVADRVNPKKFYGMSLYEGKLFLSTDGAATFVEQPFSLPGGLPTRGGTRIEGGSGWDRLYTTPGREGDLC